MFQGPSKCFRQWFSKIYLITKSYITKINCIMGQRTLSTCRIVTKKFALFSEIRNTTDVHVRVPGAIYSSVFSSKL